MPLSFRLWILIVFLSCPVGAEILQRQMNDGRIYFTNIPIAKPPQLSFGTPSGERPVAWLPLLHQVASQHDIDPRLVQAIITVESNFNPYAVSRAGAQGLMQLMPATAERYQVRDPFNPQANLEGGIRYLKDLMGLFPGELHLVLAAYNAGEGAVARYGGIPPYPETQRYVERVLTLYRGGQPQKAIYRYRTSSGSLLFTDTPR